MEYFLKVITLSVCVKFLIDAVPVNKNTNLKF
jgi:hypothetical protein